MAVETIWNVEHACGHSVDADLSDRRADQRAGFARWLASKDCGDCWRARRADVGWCSKEEWLVTRRAEETTAIDLCEDRFAMPALCGSDNAVQWARRCRADLLSAAYSHLVLGNTLTEEDWEDRIEAPVRQLSQAAWWIDQRDSQPCDLEELIVAALSGRGDPVEMET